MKTLKLFLLVLLIANLTACGRKTKTPAPVFTDTSLPTEDISGGSDLGGPYRSSGSGLESGPAASPGEAWTESSGDQPLTQRPYTGEWVNDPNLSTIYFDYDSFELTSSARSILDRNAAYLKDNVNLRVLIEGHCDERGTNEYNLALGERRAGSAREYLIGYGISPSRIDIISYGELRPAVPARAKRRGAGTAALNSKFLVERN